MKAHIIRTAKGWIVSTSYHGRTAQTPTMSRSDARKMMKLINRHGKSLHEA